MLPLINHVYCRPLLAALSLVSALMAPVTTWAFDLEDVAKKAQSLAAKPYQTPKSTLPAELNALNYDQYRDIRFKPERALWRDEKLPFEVMFFHLGLFQKEAVSINEIDADGKVRHIRFDQNDFNYGQNRFKKWGDLGFAGFRVHYPLNNPAYKDELVVFLGASYFRAIGAKQNYGLSARGLAIDTVGGNGEEFPRFSEFWLQKPTAQSKTVVIYALMESKRATGAYRFEISPGSDTVTDVQSVLFLREAVARLGIAPLTSMFQFGENQPHPEDFRPEVHDSDGLMIASGNGEWIWRPLINPKGVLTNSFQMDALRGFGLMQRDRSFTSYEDTEARYETRPSAWIKPTNDWGRGHVELVQLSTPDETNDNIVAYWVPATLPEKGQPLRLSYQIHWQGDKQQTPPNAWATQSRTGRGFNTLKANEKQYVVDFKGPAIDALAADAQVKAVVSADSNGKVLETNAYRNRATNTYRMTLRVQQIDPSKPVELRAFLQNNNDALSETWTSLIPPN